LPKVNIDPFQIYGWQGQRLSCGPLKVVLVPAIGGRIISLRFEGKEFLYTQKEHAGETFDFSNDQDLAARKKELGFRLWGGDKTWVAPQSEWQEGIPPLELDAGNYALTWEEGGVAVMTSPVCRETGLRIVRKVRLDEEMTLHVREELHNTTSDRTIRKGIWNVTQILRPCTFFVPAVAGAFHSYHHEDKTLPEAKDIFTESQDWVEVPCRKQTVFKCGGIPREGQVIVKMPLGGPKDIIWLKTFSFSPPAEYAHRSAVEIFSSGTANYAELELHAPVATLEPGASCHFEQQWRFKKV